jgi:hypothetical protein
MNRNNELYKEPEGLGEYDLAHGARGKYVGRINNGAPVVVTNAPSMQDRFPAFYEPGESFTRHYDTCVFVFDANVLLHIYKYTPSTRRQFFGILKKLRDRIWIPHQAAYEYNRRRLDVIRAQREAYKVVEVLLTKLAQQVDTSLEPYERHAVLQTGRTARTIKAAIEKEKQKARALAQKHPDSLEQDPIRDQLEALFTGRIGEPFPPEQQDLLYQRATTRQALNIPPGYKDAPQIGDIVIWYQLLEHARSTRVPIVFVTDDAKEDWWLQNPFGPRPELIQEMHDVAGVSFYMLLGDQFLNKIRTFLKLSDTKGEITQAIDEVREVREQEATISEQSNPATPLTGTIDFSSTSRVSEAMARLEREVLRSMQIFPDLSDQLPEMRRRDEDLERLKGDPHRAVSDFERGQELLRGTPKQRSQGSSLTDHFQEAEE